MICIYTKCLGKLRSFKWLYDTLLMTSFKKHLNGRTSTALRIDECARISLGTIKEYVNNVACGMRKLLSLALDLRDGLREMKCSRSAFIIIFCFDQDSMSWSWEKLVIFPFFSQVAYPFILGRKLKYHSQT